MSLVKPLVLYSGQIGQIQSGDVLDALIVETEQVTLTNAEVTDPITIGMPVYIFAADSGKKAKADAGGTKTVFALCKTASITTGNTGSFFTSGQLTSVDWTAVVGSATLSTGSVYYLSGTTAGQLTATAPTSGYIVQVGIALNTTTLQIAIKRPIQL